MSKTREELDKELEALQTAGTDQHVIKLTPDGTGDGKPPKVDAEGKPVVEPPKPPDTSTSDKEIADLKAKLAERDARLADLQSRLDRQSGEFGGNIDKLRNQVREVSEAYATLKAEHDTLKETAGKSPKPPDKVVTDDMRASFPEAADAIEQTIASLREELAKVKKMGEAGSTKAETAERNAASVMEARFNESVYGAHPDFDSVNQDPKWLTFLKTPDAFGRVLLNDLQAAWNQFNPKPIIAAVAEFKKGVGAPAAATPTAEELAAQARAESDKKDKLKAEGAPSAAAGGTKKDPGPEDIAKARQARISAYKAKFERDFQSVTAAEMEQNRKDREEELNYKLSRSG